MDATRVLCAGVRGTGTVLTCDHSGGPCGSLGLLLKQGAL